MEKACNKLDVPNFSCRGYTSQSEMWRAANRFYKKQREGHSLILIHLGDHDPSGIDMTRDIEERLRFFGAQVQVKRIALNRDQIDMYNPPENPAKISDSRANDYIRKHGTSSWELDALPPNELEDLIEDEVREYIDDDIWESVETEIKKEKAQLQALCENWPKICSYKFMKENLLITGGRNESNT
ncbi:MAG: hypothetical protein LBG91_01995 [Treponema sp.]|nr:hypothetical protein [Treponema sp.]